MIQIELVAPEGLTLSVSAFDVNSDAIVADAASVTEEPNYKGAYLAEFSTLAQGTYLVVAYDEASSPRVAIAAGYARVASGSGPFRSGNYADVVSAEHVELMRAIAQNKTVTDPVSGQLIVYADDDVTPLIAATLFEDVAETQTYRGRGAEVRGRLE